MDTAILQPSNFGSIKNDITTDHLTRPQKVDNPGSKDRHVKGREYNGHLHLKLKMVKRSPRVRIRQVLREAIALQHD